MKPLRFIFILLISFNVSMIYAQQDTDMDGNQEDSDLPRTYYWDNNVNFPDNVYLHPNVGNDTIAPYVMNAILKSTVNYTFSYGFQFMEDDKVSVSVISTTPCNVSLQTFPPKGYTLYILL